MAPSGDADDIWRRYFAGGCEEGDPKVAIVETLEKFFTERRNDYFDQVIKPEQLPAPPFGPSYTRAPRTTSNEMAAWTLNFNGSRKTFQLQTL